MGSAKKINSDKDNGVQAEADSFDPYQTYFDFLVETGASTAEAWDKVWANPSHAAKAGCQLAYGGMAS